MDKDKLEQFLVNFNKVHPTRKFTHGASRKNVTFLDVDVKLLNGQIIPDLHINTYESYRSTSVFPLHVTTSSSP